MSDIFKIDIKSSNKYLKNYKKIYFFASKIKNLFLSFIIIVLIPIIIIEIFVFFLINKKKIFKNYLILPFYNWSFGHQIIAYDYFSRIYYPNKITLVLILHPRNNPYLHYCYTNLDTLIFKSIILGNSQNIYCSTYKKTFTFFLSLFSTFNNKFAILDHLSLYKTLNNQSINTLKAYDSSKDKITEYETNTTGYYYLLKNDIGKSPSLSNDLTEKIEKEIMKIYPNFSPNNFVCLLLRRARSLNYYDSMRDAGDQTRFLKSLNKLSSQGYYITTSGESNESIFEKIQNFISSKAIVKNTSLDYYLLNLYFLTKTKLLICQHSGPSIICNSKKIKTIVIDSFPFFHGSYNAEDKIMFKKVSFNNNILSFKEILLNHKDLLYGKCNKKDGYNLIDSSEDEIFNTIFSDSNLRVEFENDMLIKYTENNNIYYWG